MHAAKIFNYITYGTLFVTTIFFGHLNSTTSFHRILVKRFAELPESSSRAVATGKFSAECEVPKLPTYILTFTALKNAQRSRFRLSSVTKAES